MGLPRPSTKVFEGFRFGVGVGAIVGPRVNVKEWAKKLYFAGLDHLNRPTLRLGFQIRDMQA